MFSAGDPKPVQDRPLYGVSNASVSPSDHPDAGVSSEPSVEGSRDWHQSGYTSQPAQVSTYDLVLGVCLAPVILPAFVFGAGCTDTPPGNGDNGGGGGDNGGGGNPDAGPVDTGVMDASVPPTCAELFASSPDVDGDGVVDPCQCTDDPRINGNVAAMQAQQLVTSSGSPSKVIGVSGANNIAGFYTDTSTSATALPVSNYGAIRSVDIGSQGQSRPLDVVSTALIPLDGQTVMVVWNGREGDRLVRGGVDVVRIPSAGGAVSPPDGRLFDLQNCVSSGGGGVRCFVSQLAGGIVMYDANGDLLPTFGGTLLSEDEQNRSYGGVFTAPVIQRDGVWQHRRTSPVTGVTLHEAPIFPTDLAKTSSNAFAVLSSGGSHPVVDLMRVRTSTDTTLQGPFSHRSERVLTNLEQAFAVVASSRENKMYILGSRGGRALLVEYAPGTTTDLQETMLTSQVDADMAFRGMKTVSTASGAEKLAIIFERVDAQGAPVEHAHGLLLLGTQNGSSWSWEKIQIGEHPQSLTVDGSRLYIAVGRGLCGQPNDARIISMDLR